MGTVVQLGHTVLEGSDWQIPEEHNLILRQTKEEPLYRILLKETIKPQVMIEEEGKEVLTEIGQSQEILGFYTSISNQSPFFQFLYVPNGAYTVDENNVITNSPSYYLDNVEYDENTGLPAFAKEGSQITLEYRGARIVRQPKTKFDSVLNRYVAVYEDRENNNEITYGYSETEYISPVAVNNYVTNPRDFDSTTGWKAGGALQAFKGAEL